jgi:hypothetical protein
MRNILRSLAFGSAKLSNGIEKFNESAKRMERGAEAYAIRTKAILDQAWFDHFRISVGSAMRVARARAEINEKLDTNFKYKEIYESISLGDGKDEVRELLPEPEWFHAPQPVEPTSIPTDPDLAELHYQAFSLAMERHIAYIDDVQHELRNRRALRQPFFDTLLHFGLKRLFEEHFSGR